MLGLVFGHGNVPGSTWHMGDLGNEKGLPWFLAL